MNVDGVDIVCYYPTYEEFLSYNDAYYRFLQEELGKDMADKMMKARYEEVTTEREGIQRKGLRYWLQTVTHDGMSIEFLPYIWGSKNVDTNETGIINAVFVDADQSGVINRLSSEGWERGEGSTEWNFNDGDWDASYTTIDQIQKGSFYTTRHHVLLFEDNSGDDIVLGSGHYEFWKTWPPEEIGHWITSTQDTEDELRNDLAEHYLREQDLDNAGWCNATDDGLAPIFDLDWSSCKGDFDGDGDIDFDDFVEFSAAYGSEECSDPYYHAAGDFDNDCDIDFDDFVDFAEVYGTSCP